MDGLLAARHFDMQGIVNGIDYKAYDPETDPKIYTNYNASDFRKKKVNNKLKGKGYEPAEQDKETYHWRTPFDLETGESKMNDDAEDYSEVTAQHLLKKMKEDKRVVTITSKLYSTPKLQKKAT